MKVAATLLALLFFGVATAEEAATPVAFDPNLAAPYLARGPAASAAAHLRLEEYAVAAAGLRRYLDARPHASDSKQTAFLLAYAELRSGQFNRAAPRFDALVASYPLLVDYHLVWAARAHLQAGRAGEALARAQRVPTSSALDGDARLLRADALNELERYAEAAVEYRGYADSYPAGYRAAEARFKLGEMLEEINKPGEAIAEFRRVYLLSPHDSWGKQAALRLSTEEARRFNATELAGRAMVLFDQMRNSESESEWRRVLSSPGLTEDLTCSARYHLAQSVFKQRERGRAAPLFEVAAAACSKAKNEDLTTKSLYQAGRCWGAKGDKDLVASRRAAELFEKVWREHGQHSYADDARMREAEVYQDLKNGDKVTELLAGIPDAFPEGDNRGEALWRLGFRAWRTGDLPTARKWLEKELQLLPREEGWWEAGRTLYWLARVDEKNGDSQQATRNYERAVREYPLSYYALLALNRLRTVDLERAHQLVDDLARDPGDAEGWKFRPRPLFGSAAFRRGVELARLGFGPEAKRELGMAGIVAPKQRNAAVSDPEQQELLWVAAVLYARAGEYSLSHFIPRYLITDYARRWPVGADRKRWLLSYPRGFAELIEKNTRVTGQPAALEFAIVREESGFDPIEESFANAVGLTQLTPAPAARFAEGLPHDRAALRDPAINIAIGARELGALWDLYDGQAVLAVAGYNAGEGAVGRWLRDPEKAGLELDEFVEAIPYDETRGYTKRVMASYFAYRWLEGGKPRARVPVLSFALPSKAD